MFRQFLVHKMNYLETAYLSPLYCATWVYFYIMENFKYVVIKKVE